MTPAAPEKSTDVAPAQPPPTSLVVAPPLPEAAQAFLAEVPDAQKSPPKVGLVRVAHADESFVLPSGELVKQLSAHVVFWWQDRQYYKLAYNPGEKGKPPDCFSVTMEGPDPRSPFRQAQSCAGCPHNAFGTGIDGRSKRCREFLNLVLLNREFGTPPIARLRVGPSSLRTFFGNEWNDPGFFYEASHRLVKNGMGEAVPVGFFQLVPAHFTLKRAGAVHCVVEYTLGSPVEDKDKGRAIGELSKRLQFMFERMKGSPPPPDEGDE